MPEPGGYLTIERRDSLPVTGRLPGRSDQENVVFNRNPCGCPFSVPDPTIWPQMLIPVAELRTQLDLAALELIWLDILSCRCGRTHPAGDLPRRAVVEVSLDEVFTWSPSHGGRAPGG
jgi:hypothetical protein